ncbi:MAG: energy-coupling factor transporter transmembrane protein EcfT [Thermoleophilia bacterium]|nr:energy-coupling factor transporter transmembrane protein EcfT [Thermoleophilia bacterium]
MRFAPAAAAIALASVAAAGLLAAQLATVAVLAGGLTVLCLRAPAARRRPYLLGAFLSGLGVVVISPFVATIGSDVLWQGPTVPVLGPVDVTREELTAAALSGARLTVVALSFAAYTLLVDHDRLLAGLRVARRSTLAAALATRLVPTLERDAHGLVEALRGRGVEVAGMRARARLVSPLVTGSLERAVNLAEAMEARGFGRPGATRMPGPSWRARDRLIVAGGLALVALGVLWL